MSERKKKAARKAEPGPRPGGYDYGHPAFEARDAVEKLAGQQFFAVKGFHISEWHPLPDGEGRPTQVHLVVQATDDINFVLRLKSKEACDGLIETLRRHRNNVWGEG